MAPFELPAVLRRIRRTADLSQSQLADALGQSQSAVAQAETGRRDLPAGVLARAAELARLRLALLDEDGTEVPGMTEGAVRDRVGRRFPAHLDTRYGDEDWWHGPERYTRSPPWYTFDRSRRTRDHSRSRAGTPEDHQLPQPGDSPVDRRDRRRAAARDRRLQELRRQRAAGELSEPPEWTCSCPPECAALEAWELPQHAASCVCRCDVD